MQTKRCSKCGEEKVELAFPLDHGEPYKHCRKCVSDYGKAKRKMRQFRRQAHVHFGMDDYGGTIRYA